jgi:hypothetical protein
MRQPPAALCAYNHCQQNNAKVAALEELLEGVLIKTAVTDLSLPFLILF